MSNVENLLGAPSVSGVYTISPAYQTLGIGATDRIFLLGHADGLTLNNPYLVQDLRAAVQIMKSNSSSPLVRGLLEAYYSGARDIWLVAVDTMSNYIADPTQRTDAWYQNYANKLQSAYDLLQTWDYVQLIVPLNAPFNSSVDFLSPLASHCANSLQTTGKVRIGILGTLKGSAYLQSEIDAMANDPRLMSTVIDGVYSRNVASSVYINTPVASGAFVSVFVGEGIVNITEMPTTYTSSLTASIAGQISVLDISTAITTQTNPVAVDMVAPFTSAQVVELANASLNPLTKTTLGRRGKPFQVKAATDNTLAPPESDFWSLTVFRTVGEIATYAAALGKQNLGGVGMGQYQKSLYDYLSTLRQKLLIQDFDLSVGRDPSDRYNVLVSISVKPYCSLRFINFSVTVGPGA